MNCDKREKGVANLYLFRVVCIALCELLRNRIKFLRERERESFVRERALCERECPVRVRLASSVVTRLGHYPYYKNRATLFTLRDFIDVVAKLSM